MTVRVAVVGAGGFVGRHAVGALRARGAEVVATARDLSRLEALPSDVTRVELDIAEPIRAFERLGRPDVVLNLAWGGLPNYQSPHHFVVEVPLQYQFILRLIGDGAKSIVVTGTCLEYGMRSGPLSEDMIPDPRTAYAVAKVSLCRQLELLAQASPFAFTWARLFYLFGEGQAPTSLWSTLQDAIGRGQRRFDMSKGEQLRDFLPVEQAADMLAKLALLREGTGIVNVCSGEPRSVRSLVEGWIKEAGAPIELNLGHYAYPAYEPMAFWGSNVKLKAVMDAE